MRPYMNMFPPFFGPPLSFEEIEKISLIPLDIERGLTIFRPAVSTPVERVLTDTPDKGPGSLP